MSTLKLAEILENDEAKTTEKMIDMYLGDQEECMIEALNDPHKGRKDWKSRGIVPRTRNIMKMIIEKSGLLFADKAPELMVFDSKSAVEQNEGATYQLKTQLEGVNWIEFFTNFDGIVRLLKSALVLVQYDAEDKNLVLDILTQKNCYIVSKNNRIDTLIYKVSEDEDVEQFRVFTKELIQDIQVNEKTGEESIIQVIPNPFGIIPVAAFHDTNTPIFDFWNVIPNDLLQINELYNFHLTDSEYAASWAKLQTLFTNCKIITSDDMQLEAITPYGSPLPRMAPTVGALIGGPSKVIQIDTMGVDSPFIEYKGPKVDLAPIDDMVNKWVSDFAQDWSVRVKTGGSSNADSGFKLIVEEMDNLELRKKRAKMFEAGFNRLFQVIKKVSNVYNAATYPEDSVLFVKFAEPSLPVDQKVNEEVWSRRIAEGRASRKMYFQEVHGMSEEEAILAIQAIDQEKPSVAGPRTLQITKTTGA